MCGKQNGPMKRHSTGLTKLKKKLDSLGPFNKKILENILVKKQMKNG
jgi:hypothetical protein